MSANPSVSVPRSPRRISTGRSRRCWIAAVLIALAALSGIGCSKRTTGPAARPLNSDLPNANGRIAAQHVFGSTKVSVISDLQPAPGSSPWFYGCLDGHWTLGRLDAGGAPSWHVGIPYGPYDFTVLGPASPVPDGAIVVGAQDSDHDGHEDVGYATLVTSAGAVVHQEILGSDSSHVWIHGIAPLSDSLFVVVGGEQTPGRYNPLVALLAVTADSLEIRQPMALLTIPGGAICVASDPADAQAAPRRVYLSTTASSETSPVTIHGVDVEPGSLAPYSVAWSTPLTGKSAGTYVADMNALDGAVYVAGWANDPDKGTPVSGDYWTSGLAVRLSSAGVVAWTIVVPASKHSDVLYAIQPAADAVTAMGRACAYFNTDNGHLFGYGWIQRFANPSGHVTSSLTFGDAGCESGFGDGYLDGTTLNVGGWTGRYAQDGPCPAWWCALNLAGTLPASAAQASEPVRAGESPPPLRARNSPARGPGWGDGRQP